MVAITVADVMTRGVETVGPDEPAVDVARRLRELDVGSLVVVDGGPAGIVTDTDLIELLTADGAVGTDETDGTEGAAETDGAEREEETDGDERAVKADAVDGVTAGDVMSSPLVTIDPDASVVAAVRRMREHGVSKLPVVEGDELVGIVTTRDVSHYVPQVVRRASLERDDRPSPEYRVRPETAYERDDWSFETLAGSDEGVAVGDRVEFSKTLDDEDVRAFAEATGDTNRLHLDDDYAAETRFGRRIAHGTLVAGLVSAALARLPGLTIYLSQDLSFLEAVDVGARVTAVCEVLEDLGRDRYVLTTDVFAGDEQVVEGEAVVLIDPLPEAARPTGDRARADRFEEDAVDPGDGNEE